MLAVVYAKGTGVLRRTVRFDDARTTASEHFQIAPGEAIFFLHADITDTSQLHLIENEVVARIGRPIDRRRCAVIRDGRVDGFICADPHIDSLPDATLALAEDWVDVADLWSEAGGFVPWNA